MGNSDHSYIFNQIERNYILDDGVEDLLGETFDEIKTSKIVQER